MRLPTMKQLDSAGPDDARKLLDSFAEYWLLNHGRGRHQLMDAVERNGGINAYNRRKATYNRRHREYFGK